MPKKTARLTEILPTLYCTTKCGFVKAFLNNLHNFVKLVGKSFGIFVCFVQWILSIQTEVNYLYKF